MTPLKFIENFKYPKSHLYLALQIQVVSQLIFSGKCSDVFLRGLSIF